MRTRDMWLVTMDGNWPERESSAARVEDSISQGGSYKKLLTVKRSKYIERRQISLIHNCSVQPQNSFCITDEFTIRQLIVENIDSAKVDGPVKEVQRLVVESGDNDISGFK